MYATTATIYLLTEQKTRIPFNVLIVPLIAAPANTSLQHTAVSLPYLKTLKLAHPITASELSASRVCSRHSHRESISPRGLDVTCSMWLSEPTDPDSPLCTYRFKAV